ncbi:MAG: D-alanyl-D-alanine carboxypeptidase [Clostridia bacterium]|nr:D-alanyl-D-alanine carboxypeptidase [Clostridia bacterium]
MQRWKAPLCVCLAALLAFSLCAALSGCTQGQDDSPQEPSENEVALPPLFSGGLTLRDKSPFSAEEQAQAKAPPSAVSAFSAVLMEAESGRIVWEKQADLPLPMASTTKIMTALTALSLASPDTRICVDEEAVGVEGSSIYLESGECLTLEQLLYALLLESANDAAAAIAIGLCGSISAFAEEMNRIADSLSLSATHFCNPHGLDEENHYTTAADLAHITREALKNPLLRQIVSTKTASIPHPTLPGGRSLSNHNKLLHRYSGCIGVKTGYTKKSGRCLVSAAERDGVTLIAVTLRAADDWQDHETLLDYGFSRFRSITVCDANELLVCLPTVGGETSYALLSNSSALRLTLPLNAGRITARLELPPFAYAPLTAGEVCGYAVFYGDRDGDGNAEPLGRLPLTVCLTVEQKQKKLSLLDRIKLLLGLL